MELKDQIEIEIRLTLKDTSKATFYTGMVYESKLPDGNKLLCEITAIEKLFIVGTYMVAQVKATPLHLIKVSETI